MLVSVLRSCEPLARDLDLFLGVHSTDPGRAFDGLAGLQVLVDLEEVLDFQPVELREVIDITEMVLAWVVRWHADDLVVAAFFVGHAEHADRTTADQAAGEGRRGQQDQRIQRVTVEAERVVDEPVVGRVLGRREQRPVEPDAAGRPSDARKSAVNAAMSS